MEGLPFKRVVDSRVLSEGAGSQIVELVCLPSFRNKVWIVPFFFRHRPLLRSVRRFKLVVAFAGSFAFAKFLGLKERMKFLLRRIARIPDNVVGDRFEA